MLTLRGGGVRKCGIGCVCVYVCVGVSVRITAVCVLWLTAMVCLYDLPVDAVVKLLIIYIYIY